jgi:hypothetical protein
MKPNTTAALPQYIMACLIALGFGLFAIGAGADTSRIWANVLVCGFGMLGLGLGAAVLLAFFHLTGARWNEAIHPAVVNMTRLLPAGAVGVIFVVLVAPWLYPWTREDAGSGFQALWLSRPFFLARSFVYLASWLSLVHFLVRAPSIHRNRISAVFLVVFAITCWLASVDWIMSLEPKWSSTIFGVYHFAGMFLGALAGVIVVAIWFDQRGDVLLSHMRDLGTLLFSFSSFWMYIWFCQYLLIWYVNNPEETQHYVRRQGDLWQPFFHANVILSWGLPFVVLLFRAAKENPFVLLAVAVIVLVGRWLDLYLMIVPAVVGDPSIWDAGLLLATMALAGLIVSQRWQLWSESAQTQV